MRPLEWRIMKAIFSAVTSWAGMMRSPSFSREGESRTMMKFPEAKEEMQEGMESKIGSGVLEGMVVVAGDFLMISTASLRPISPVDRKEPAI